MEAFGERRKKKNGRGYLEFPLRSRGFLEQHDETLPEKARNKRAVSEERPNGQEDEKAGTEDTIGGKPVLSRGGGKKGNGRTARRTRKCEFRAGGNILSGEIGYGGSAMLLPI